MITNWQFICDYYNIGLEVVTNMQIFLKQSKNRYGEITEENINLSADDPGTSLPFLHGILLHLLPIDGISKTHLQICPLGPLPRSSLETEKLEVPE